MTDATGTKTVRLEPMTTYLVATEASVTSTGSGLVLPDTLTQPSFGKIEALGPDVKGFAVADTVVFKADSAVDLHVDGVRYLLLKADSVMAKVLQ
ncbi:co-chaperone GroES family protein [Rhodococcus sp. KRD162]|uniref:co-chaperone GroES family protein n=1 Tax=unclassified Rhodococcus (in: high G+C Gram-positive bacteria) TaxID=192944 RepID=UPI0019D2B526|nr:co-chaperone GroES family protein [Rhodococcus sp. KRD162]